MGRITVPLLIFISTLKTLKVAVMVLSVSMVTVQVSLPEQPPLVHPDRYELPIGVGVRIT